MSHARHSPTSYLFWLTALLITAHAVIAPWSAQAGEVPPPKPEPAAVRDDRFQASVESAINFGVNNPNHYVTNPYFLSVRWQPFATEQFFHTPVTFAHQWEFGTVIVPFYQGPENHYFGLFVGTRLVCGLPGSRWTVYVGGRFAVGAIDSSGPPHGQGQDLTFNGIVTGGVQYQISPRQQISLSLLYQHFSNGGLSEPETPNNGLNTLGPMLGWNFSF